MAASSTVFPKLDLSIHSSPYFTSVSDDDDDDVIVISDSTEKKNYSKSVVFYTKEEEDKGKCMFGSSNIAEICGLNQYKSPQEAFKKLFRSLTSTHQEGYQSDAVKYKNTEHGLKYEAASIELFHKEVLRKLFKVQQQVTMPPSYTIPIPGANPNFPSKDDHKYFGCTLDVEGSVVDVEIKNPVSYASFLKNYAVGIDPMYFCQVQHQLAIRNRPFMYFFATSYDADSGTLLAWVVWQVKFIPDFYKKIIYEPCRLVIDNITKRRNELPSQIKWHAQPDENGVCVFKESADWLKLHEASCSRIQIWKNIPYFQNKLSS
jgi:hypothetical protein